MASALTYWRTRRKERPLSNQTSKLEAARGPNGATVIRRWPDGPVQEIAIVNSFRDMTEPIGETAEAIRFAILFAAAPDTLKILEDVKKRIEDSEQWWIRDPDCGGFDLEAIEAAIAKAKGV